VAATLNGQRHLPAPEHEAIGTALRASKSTADAPRRLRLRQQLGVHALVSTITTPGIPLAPRQHTTP